MTTNELVINGRAVPFRFGLGFMRELDKRVKTPVAGIPGVTKCVGFAYTVGDMIDGSIDALIDILDVANKTENPRITRSELEAWIEDDDTDIDALRDQVLDFLSNANACRLTLGRLMERVKEMEEK